MPLLGFKAQFVPSVENGVAASLRHSLPHRGVHPKRQTIRAHRKDGRDPVPGDSLFLYTGLRTKAARRLGEVTCRKVQVLCIDRKGGRIRLDGRELDRAAVKRLVRSDGFGSAEELIDFVRKLHGIPFRGIVIRW